MSRPDEDGFLSRWSKRKLRDPDDLPPEPEAEVVSAPESTVEEKTDEEILEELGLPDPEEMKEGDDFSGFMNGAVPTRLRNRALRKLWLTNPVLANLDEMVDYGEDFTDAATVIENMQTAYQVGKGWLPDEPAETEEPPEADAEADEEAVVVAESEAELPPDEIPVEELAVGPRPQMPEPEPTPELAAAPSPEPIENPAPVPRKMRFRFESG